MIAARISGREKGHAMRYDMPQAVAITSGPRHHWFGYYDKLQFSPDDRHVLGMEVGFEHRPVEADDEIRLGVIDLEDGNRWTDIGRTKAWCWQQGCMLQWIPSLDPEGGWELIWNDREDGRFVSKVMDFRTGATRTLPEPVYALSPDGRTAVAPDFRRLNDTRPGYGYAGITDPYRDVLAPEESGIRRIDLANGESELIVTFAELAALPYRHGDLSGAKHWFNHLLFSPDGSRFIFLHRWRFGDGGFHTRMMTSALDGTDIRVVDDSGDTSHFIWRDGTSILEWTKVPPEPWAFYLFEDGGGRHEMIGQGVMTDNGHCTYLPGNRFVLNDTYPLGQERLQRLYLYDVADGRRLPLGDFHSPAEYSGVWRCDLHPRSSRSGRLVTIDSPHGGHGRQLYLLDIGPVLDAQRQSENRLTEA